MTIQHNNSNLCLATKIINTLGGVTSLSQKVGVSQSAVSHWINRGIPKNYLMRNKLEALLMAEDQINPIELIKELRDG